MGISVKTKQQIRQATQHPVTFWRGAELPEDQVHPWEGGIQFLAEALKGFMNGFTDIRGRLYLGKGEGKIAPNMKSISDVITITWDALNDPLIGVYMDRKRFSDKVHRKVMRINATLSPLLILIQCFDFGLTPTQRLIEWILIGMFSDIMSTSNAVSESKVWAGITPHFDQRGVLQQFRSFGGHVGGVFSGISIVLMGLKDVFHITDYQIMIWGAMLFAPLTIFSRWLPSFAKQRVDFTMKVNAEGDEPADTHETEHLTFAQSFAIVKQNRWFLMWTVVNFIRIIIPRTDEMFLYRFLLPKMVVRGKPLGGELLFAAKSVITGLPGFLLSPFAIKVVRLFGNNVTFIKAHVLVIMFTRLTTYLVGYKSTPRLIYMFLMEMVRGVMDMWSPVPHGMMNYEMYDYVEWKTGYRSEGITNSVDGMLNKLVKNNLSSVFGNLVTDWTGYLGYDVPVEQQPKRFLNTIWPLMHVGVLCGEVVVLIALFWFKYPHDPKEVERDLIERRALAKERREQTQAEVTVQSEL